MVTRYTCHGSVRGDCGSLHRTVEAAERCCDRDAAQCAAVGGYSDRFVVAVEGETMAALRLAARRGDWRALRSYEYEDDEE